MKNILWKSKSYDILKPTNYKSNNLKRRLANTAPPFGHFYAKIVAMDKIIKTISESGSFRALSLTALKPSALLKKNIKLKLAQL